MNEHIHCNCEKAENKDILWVVYEDPEDYVESISFAQRSSMRVGGYEEHTSSDIE